VPTPINRIIIYSRKMPEMIDFYCRHFGFSAHQPDDDRIVELRPASGGLTILLHPAGKGQKQGQSVVKLVFDVEDVEWFCRDAKERGLDFGPIHRADGYAFANARDPSGNSVSISSRAFAP
jgi:predicted enzyme related to lactoylglutathione lyase